MPVIGTNRPSTVRENTKHNLFRGRFKGTPTTALCVLTVRKRSVWFMTQILKHSRSPTLKRSPHAISCCSCIKKWVHIDYLFILKIYFISQFGCAVLLDRVWDVNKLVDCSKTFKAVLEQITNDNDDPRISQVRRSITDTRQSNHGFIRSMLRNFNDLSMVTYFEYFTTNCSSDQNTIAF